MHDLDRLYWQGYDKGVIDTLESLADVYEDIKETDAWKDAFGNDKEDND